jgi:serine/threonine protein kinase
MFSMAILSVNPHLIRPGGSAYAFLCLGRFAVKKIAVGQSSSYLLKILREVHLLETLRHPNIITYHHAWLESSQFSSFGPKIPTLQYARLPVDIYLRLMQGSTVF